MPLSVFPIESVARILVIAKDSGTIARKTGSPFVQLISQEISQATSSLTFLTRNSRLEARGTVNLLLSGTVVGHQNYFQCTWILAENNFSLLRRHFHSIETIIQPPK